MQGSWGRGGGGSGVHMQHPVDAFSEVAKQIKKGHRREGGRGKSAVPLQTMYRLEWWTHPN